jgi:hypothetical protein
MADTLRHTFCELSNELCSNKKYHYHPPSYFSGFPRKNQLAISLQQCIYNYLPGIVYLPIYTFTINLVMLPVTKITVSNGTWVSE